MPPLAPWRALSAVLILSWGRPPAARACPHPCSCYVPSEVHCTFRSLAAVPAGISPHVERINLGFNSIQALSETSFAGLRQLELLMLHGNSIPSIPDGALRDLHSLQVFKVSYNKLQALTAQTLQGLVSVVRLHLDHNEIAFIHPHAFEGLASLRLLHLEGNLLQQLHPGTFGTFSLLDHFRVSSLRHLYLAENRMRSLPAGMLESLPLLENLYLQGNPWSCDCSLQWLLQWDARSKGILKCKKDKAYPGGQLCASCSSPRKLQKQELHKLTEAACVRPSIESPLWQNRSGASQEEEEEEDQDDDSGSPRPPEGLRVPPWNVSLNMTDEHGNAAHLVCDIPRRTHLRRLHLNQTEAQEMDVNATLALDFECPMTRGNYEKLWKLIAYYSEVPVTLHREDTVAADPGVGAHYRQDSDSHALYYTGVRAHVLAEPAWVLQPTVALQLNRRQSTATKVLLSYSAALSFTVSSADAARPARSRSWVMIEPDAGAHAAQTVLEGRPCQLSCHVKASESPSTFWVLPDGTVLQGPMEDSGGRFSILTSGWLRIRAAERADSGVYQCVARVRDDMDRVVYRLAVEPADTQPPAKHAVTVQKNSGDPLALPCEAVAAPDAQVSWILPNQRMVSQVANTSQVHLWPNGTLSIPRLQASDSGYYKCVAVNQQGVARFTVAVAVTKKGSVKAAKRGRRPAGEALSRLRADVLDHEGGSGVGGEEGPSRRPPPPKDHDTVLQPKGPKKGRRKPNPWKSPEKEPESTVAEGRRVFESRRRLHMANKQINPERWADILARVRGKNVSPKGTPGPEAGKTTATPTLSLGVTAVSPVASPPSLSAGQCAGSADEFSADASLFAEEAAVSSTVAPGPVSREQGQAGVSLAEATVPSPAAEEFIEDAFSEKTGDPTGAGAASMWAAATTQVTGLPYPSSPAAQTAGGSHAEPPATTGHAGAQPAPGPTSLDHPLDASEPSVSPELQAPPQAEDKTEGPRSSPALWPAESPTSQPFGDFTSGAPDVGAQGGEQGETGRAPLAEKAASTQDPRAMAQGSQQTSPRPQGEGALQRHPTNSRAAERRGQSTAPTLWAESTPGGRRSVAPFAPPREATLRPVGDEGLISAAAPTRQPPRRRPSGRRRGRPHKFRHRQTHTPAATLAPTQTSPMPPTPAGEGKPPKQVTTSLAPTSWVEATVGTPKQVETEQPTEPGTKGTPRRKLGKRPKKHRQGPATMSSASPAPDLGASAGNQHKSGGTPPAERFPAPTLVSLKTGGPLEVTRVADSGTSTPRIPVPPHTLPDAEAATRSPVGGGSVTKKQDTHSLVPSEPGVTVTSPPGTEVSTVQELKEEPPSSSSPGPGDGDPPTETPTGGLQTEAPAATASEYVLDAWSLSKERESEGFNVSMSPPGTLSTSYQPEGALPPTSLSREKAESPPAWTQPTPRVRDSEGTAAALPPSEMSPPNQGRTGAPGEDLAGPSPPTPPATAAERTPMRPTHPSSTAAPASTRSSENASFIDEGLLAANTRPGPKEGAEPLWRRNEVSTLPSRWDELRVTPKPAPGPEDDRTQNILPRGPDGHPREGRFHVFQQTTHVPAGGAGRPPSATTQSPFRHLVTLHPPLPPTNKPGTTAHPSGVSPASQPPAAPTTSGPTGPVTPRWHPSSPSRWPSAGPNRVTSNPNGFGVNSLPDLRDPVGRLPSIRAPPNANGRFPYLPNRSLSFPPLGLTPKTPTPTSASPWVRGTHIHPSPYNRIHSQSLVPMDLGPPAPPRVPRPRTGSPPPIVMQNAPLVHPTRGAIPPVTSAGPPARSFHHSSSKIFSAAGGPPAAPKFWTLGEKPQILTKPPQTVSVSADTDVTLPCEATGKPTPFVTWTKVSTGALLTTNTRVQRFQVLQNGTFIIRKVQAQDRGQYVCTAKNLHGTDRAAVLLSVTVQQPQILASHYQDVTVYLGDTIAMECLAKGTPAPQISWIFPDRRVWQAVSPVEGRVTLHENRTLSIKEATFADRGVYKCVASNAAGADSLAIRLHVAALPPVIHQEKLENISLPPGLSIHIHCTAKAAPLPSVRWVLWDGTQVRPSQFLRGNLFVFPNGTLYIRNLAPKDSGRYECVAANVVGTARRTVQLTVRRAAANARITGTSPHRTNVHYGGTLRLDCSASGDPWPRILWRLPSKRMIDALFSFDTRSKVFSNGTLVVKSVTDKDAGDYLCVARNKVGDDFVVLKVNVVMQPAKIEHKEENDHRVFYGGDLKVDCVASGLPNPDISWSLPDGSLVSSLMQADEGGAQAQRYVVFHNGTLYFNEVGLREEGDYTCVAENQVGKDEMTVRVQVVAQPAAIRNKTHAVVHVAYGDVVSVACDAKGEPAPTVTWLTPTNKLIAASSDKYQLSRDGTLLIRKAQRSDSGNYTCLVRNSAGEDRKLVWVQVQVQPPKINGHPEAITTVRQEAAGGSRQLIHCRAEGIPAPKVLWAFPEGVVLPAPYYGNRVTIHRNGTLDIRGLRQSDSVPLTCIGRNEGGEARLIVQLTVLEPTEKPAFHDPVNEKITAAAGHTISLNCSARGTPPPTLVWLLPNGTELASGQQLLRFYHKTDGKLHISGLSAADAGAYRCVARNVAGRTERLVSLKVGLKPEASQQYRNLVSIVHGETLRLPCASPGGRQPRVTWTLPSGVALRGPQTRGRVSLGENGTLTVREASVLDRGTYACQADTDRGPSVVHFPVIVIAYPPRVTSEPTPVIYTRPGSTVKVACMAVGLPKPEISWELPDKSRLTAGTQARMLGNTVLHAQGSLTIQQVSPRDAGFYKCTAKNVLGSDSKTTYVHVY